MESCTEVRGSVEDLQADNLGTSGESVLCLVRTN